MIEPDKLKEWKSFAAEIRKKLLEAIASKGIGHVGGSLSIADTLAVLYGGVMNIDPQNPNWEDRDYIVISKGHSGPAMYAALALKGYFPMEMLKTLNRHDAAQSYRQEENPRSRYDYRIARTRHFACRRIGFCG